MDRYFKFAIQDANDSIMADQEAQNLPSAEQFAQIMNFCAARSIPENDAESNLLNKAVLMFNEENNAKAKLESSEADKASFDLLRSKMENLEAARKRFETTLGEGQKNQLAKAPNKTEAVLHLIDTATMDWCKSSETGSRTAKSIKNTFHQMCSSIDQHAVLLTMLPKEHEYVTVFFGAFNSIVAASVMHQTMAIGLPRIVDELNLIVADVAKKIGMFPQAKVQIRRTLIELYTRIFNLLADLMEWYRLKRKLMKLLRKDCYGDFEKSLQEIRIWADAVTKEAWNNFAIESRQDSDEHRKTLKRIEEKIEALNSFYQLQADSDTLQASQRVHLMHTDPAAYHDQLAESITTKLLQRFQDMGFSQTLTLASMSAVRSLEFGPSSAATGHNLGTHPPAVQYHPTPSLMSIMSDTTAGAQDSDQGSIESFELPSREEIALYSCVLDNWYNESDIHPLHLRQRPKSPPVMHETITARITEWIKSPQSQALCIQLPYSAGPDSFGGNLASYVVSSAWETNYPIISHFCSLPRGVETGRSPETVALCAMMASFIRQLVVMLPDSLPESAVDLDEARFESLDGTLRTWNEMLSLFAELLTLVEGSKLIVIHGVQLLDHKDTMDPIHEVLALIRENIEDRDRSVKQIIKVLFVTEGQSRAVVPWLDVRRGEHFLFNGVERPRF